MSSRQNFDDTLEQKCVIDLRPCRIYVLSPCLLYFRLVQREVQDLLLLSQLIKWCHLVEKFVTNTRCTIGCLKHFLGIFLVNAKDCGNVIQKTLFEDSTDLERTKSTTSTILI